MTSVLVTGAAGFIGGALCRRLKRSGHEVFELTSEHGDIARRETLAGAPAARHVFHLAGRTFVPDSWLDPAGFQRTNVLGTANVLEYCRTHGARLTFVSAYLYGAPERLPVSEDVIPRPNNPYALSKYLAEQSCAFYASCYGTSVTVIRPFNIFGPGQPDIFLIPQIIRQIREKRAIRVSDLAPRRDFVYLDDFVDALVRTLNFASGYQVINIGSGRSLSVRDVIETVQDVAGTHLPIETDGETRRGEINDVYADIAKASALLEWTPKLTFRQGIERMLLRSGD
ncbi:MAG: NAD-dependent epimerase/dehydratase family protein [Gemmatimonadaceae bacterium]|nr:NAD-dependent epimerase/dehydratase family protein [Gemmatimonadaceae bacterium]